MSHSWSMHQHAASGPIKQWLHNRNMAHFSQQGCQDLCAVAMIQGGKTFASSLHVWKQHSTMQGFQLTPAMNALLSVKVHMYMHQATTDISSPGRQLTFSERHAWRTRMGQASPVPCTPQTRCWRPAPGYARWHRRLLCWGGPVATASLLLPRSSCGDPVSGPHMGSAGSRFPGLTHLTPCPAPCLAARCCPVCTALGISSYSKQRPSCYQYIGR